MTSTREWRHRIALPPERRDAPDGTAAEPVGPALAEAPQRLLLSGASGLLGSAIAAEQRAKGNLVVELKRAAAGAGDLLWDPTKGVLEPQDLEGFDGVIHLAGEPVAGRWTAAKKRRIRESRVRGTALLAGTLALLKRPPAVFLCASGVNFYGDRGSRLLDENDPEGSGFLAGVAADWEAACAPLRSRSRVVNLRIGMVLAMQGGALKTMLPMFKLGLGGVIGSGKQYLSWVSLRDVVRAVDFLLDAKELAGAVNIVAPEAATGEEFTQVLAAAAGRPAVLSVPSWLARLAFGELAEETVLGSLRVRPKRLLDAGFSFRDATLAQALSACGLRGRTASRRGSAS